MYHYTYLITHPTTLMKYIGVRTSKCLPELDTTYWGSSKHLPTDIGSTHTKQVLAIFFTREDAVSHEILLHKQYEVASNPEFYNRANQTSTKFDTTGIKLEGEHLEKTRKAFLGRRHSESTKQKLSDLFKGKPKSEEAKANMSKAHKTLAKSEGYIHPNKGISWSEEVRNRISQGKKAKGNSKSIKNPTFTPWFITNITTDVTTYFYHTTKNEYAEDVGTTIATLKSAFKRSKGVKPLKRGFFKDRIIGNINKDIV